MIAEPVSSERGDVDDGPGSPVPVQNEVEQPLAIAVVQREEEPTVPGRNSHSLHLSLIHSLQCVHKSTKKNMLHSMMIDITTGTYKLHKPINIRSHCLYYLIIHTLATGH